MNRKTGDFEEGFDKANKLIDIGFDSEFGPGDLPIETRGRKLNGVIAPSCLDEFSSAALAWAYKEVAESVIADVYIVLGRDDNKRNKFSTFLFSDWDTSFGTVKVDVEFGRKLIKGFPKLRNSFEAFQGNNFVDIQLPFLQYANKTVLGKIKFVPILVGDVSYEEICGFADAVSDTGKNVCVIASSNLTYYGKEYENVPFLHGIKENIYARDKGLLGFVNNLDVKGFLESSKKGGVFDRNVIGVFMEIMRGLGCKKGRVLNYYTSGDLEGYGKAIGFGVVAF
ncbi:MAG: AmmeMemoRadiSam system protein B [Candidatus Woesearchaeota archaeon]